MYDFFIQTNFVYYNIFHFLIVHFYINGIYQNKNNIKNTMFSYKLTTIN